jgi:hypothetical protein
MTISQATQEMLKAHAGRGVSNDPELLLRSKIRLLQNSSTKPKHGRGESGLYCLPDEAQTCASKLRAILGAVYSIYVEHAPNDKPTGGEHFVLPAEAVRDGYNWLLPNKNVIQTESRLAGIFNGVEGELDLARTGMKVARALNSDARSRATKLGLPLFGLAYELGALEVPGDRGTYFGVTFTFIGASGSPEGPTEEEVLRASAIFDLVQATIAEAKREAENHKGEILPPPRPALAAVPRPLITSGNAALKTVETAPPPDAYDGPDDDIPF